MQTADNNGFGIRGAMLYIFGHFYKLNAVGKAGASGLANVLVGPCGFVTSLKSPRHAPI